MVFEMVKKKVISEEQARLSAQSNVILKALGINPDIEVEVTERPYQKGDKFILCTDGFWGAMPEEEFIRHLSEKSPINKILESTANVVESIGRNSGSEYDNLTAAILEMNNNSILKEIGDKSFYKCLSLSSIIIPSSVEKIGNKAFYSSYVTYIYLPLSVIYLGEEVFDEDNKSGLSIVIDYEGENIPSSWSKNYINERIYTINFNKKSSS
jgi:hypothetical protein